MMIFRRIRMQISISRRVSPPPPPPPSLSLSLSLSLSNEVFSLLHDAVAGILALNSVCLPRNFVHRCAPVVRCISACTLMTSTRANLSYISSLNSVCRSMTTSTLEDFTSDRCNPAALELAQTAATQRKKRTDAMGSTKTRASPPTCYMAQ